MRAQDNNIPSQIPGHHFSLEKMHLQQRNLSRYQSSSCKPLSHHKHLPLIYAQFIMLSNFYTRCCSVSVCLVCICPAALCSLLTLAMYPSSLLYTVFYWGFSAVTVAEAFDFTVLSAYIMASLITVSLATDTRCVCFKVKWQLWRPVTIQLSVWNLQSQEFLWHYIQYTICELSSPHWLHWNYFIEM